MSVENHQVEQRLLAVFRGAAVDPTPDLFSRVLHSIEEDRRHRRRVVWTVATTLAALAAVVAVGALGLVDGTFGWYVHRPTMELLEIVVLTTLLLGLGPAIRRFGRGYAADLWAPGSTTPRELLRVLDVAYYLVGAGYILLSTELAFDDGVRADLLAEQLGGASIRIGGLLLTLGLLHATTFVLLPLLALIDNSTRAGRAVPRWVLLVLLVVVLAAAPVAQAAIGIALNS